MLEPFDKFFDFDGDGKLSAFEFGAELDFLDRMCREEQKVQNSDDDRNGRRIGSNLEAEEE